MSIAPQSSSSNPPCLHASPPTCAQCPSRPSSIEQVWMSSCIHARMEQHEGSPSLSNPSIELGILLPSCRPHHTKSYTICRIAAPSSSGHRTFGKHNVG